MSSNGTEPMPSGARLSLWLRTRLCPTLRLDSLHWQRGSVLIITFMAYCSYHITRKPFAVIRSQLVGNCSNNDCWPPFNGTDGPALLGAMDSAFLFTYAACMFLSGMACERVSVRAWLCGGMILSGGFCALLGAARWWNIHTASYFLAIQTISGAVQSTGWPAVVSIMGHWFGSAKRGLVFGVWNAHTCIGNVLGTVLAAVFVESDWGLSLAVPGACQAAAALLVWGFLPLPESQVHTDPLKDHHVHATVIVGDQSANLRASRHSANTSPEEASEQSALLPNQNNNGGSPISLKRALGIPGVCEFALSLFFAKLVAYTFLFWLPYYITSSAALTPAAAARLSAAFDAGGVIGAVLAGALLDKSGTPATVCAAGYIAAAPALAAYWALGALNPLIGAILLIIAGAAVNAPYALITTAVSADLGTHPTLSGNSKALATVTAIIDGTGSVGAALGPLIVGAVSRAPAGWNGVFILLLVADLLAGLCLARVVRRELREIRSLRRDVRVE